MAKATENTKEIKVTENTTKATGINAEEYLKEKVPYIVKRPEGSKEEFTTVTVNGKNYQIAYNKTVMIPRFVKEIIDNSDKASDEAMQNQKKYADLFNGNAGNL